MSFIDQQTKQEQLEKNVRIILAVICLAALALVARLWYLQVIRGGDYNLQAQNNRIRVRRMRALRGLVYDRHRRLLADNHPGFNLSLIPENVIDIESLAAAIQRHVPDLEAVDIIHRYGEIPRHLHYKPVKLKNNLDRDELARLAAHQSGLPGILVEIEPLRTYPFDDDCAHILGYLGFINEEELSQPAYESYYPDDLVGRTGIEAAYEEVLRGTDGKRQVEVNAMGREVRSHVLAAPTAGASLTLTIDIELQRHAATLLKELTGAIVALDPHTGDVLAMASSPTFSNNLFAARISREDWQRIHGNPLHPLQNRAIQGTYPPGSTFKPIVAAAALEDGVITERTAFFCNGTHKMGDTAFRCWNKYGHGGVDLGRSLKESCDVYYYNLGEQIPIDRIAHYAEMFGLGRETGIDLPEERPGLVPTSSWKLKHIHQQWYGGETLSVAIGQGYTTATPLQMAAAYVPLANGGTWFRPRLVRDIIRPETGGRIVTPAAPRGLEIDPRHLEKIRRALWRVVNEPRGTAHALGRQHPELEMAGKTGTAQVVRMGSGPPPDEEEIPWKYRDHAWFVGFAPFREPRIVVAALVEHGGHGGSAAGPLVSELIARYLGNGNEANERSGEP
ncbi:MAG: penicillin-binding protein 2 [Deltaproteobacteria bacterium]|nr:penicillin-binding protein 2 [Candidatus Anaeroferrophillacea bacterium]